MKVQLSGECSRISGNVFGMTPEQHIYVVRRSRNPAAMQDYLMGNWLTAGIKAVGGIVSKAVAPIQTVIKKVIPGSAGVAAAALAPAALPIAVAASPMTILPVAAANIAIKAKQAAEASSQAYAARQAEIAQLEKERIELLKKQEKEAKEQQKAAANATQQLQAAAAAATAASSVAAQPTASKFDFKKLLPFAGLALIPILLSGDK